MSQWLQSRKEIINLFNLNFMIKFVGLKIEKLFKQIFVKYEKSVSITEQKKSHVVWN